jgi:hypothetical protein
LWALARAIASESESADCADADGTRDTVTERSKTTTWAARSLVTGTSK